MNEDEYYTIDGHDIPKNPSDELVAEAAEKYDTSAGTLQTYIGIGVKGDEPEFIRKAMKYIATGGASENNTNNDTMSNDTTTNDEEPTAANELNTLSENMLVKLDTTKSTPDPDVMVVDAVVLSDQDAAEQHQPERAREKLDAHGGFLAARGSSFVTFADEITGVEVVADDVTTLSPDEFTAALDDAELALPPGRVAHLARGAGVDWREICDEVIGDE